MKWSYILFLPALISIFWAFIIILTRKRLTHAQILFTLSLLVDAVAITSSAIFFRGQVGNLYIYDYLLEISVSFCPAIYYICICSLTEPRGVTLKQRRSFFPPILFTLGLTIAAFGMHPSRYQAMCLQVIDTGHIPWHPSDFPYNFMIFWNQILFPVFILTSGIIILILSERKVRLYKYRFDSFYSKKLNLPHLDIREIVIISWIFLPFGMLTIYLIAFRPYYYKYWLILSSILLSVIQYLSGRFAYRYTLDARFLAKFIKES